MQSQTYDDGGRKQMRVPPSIIEKLNAEFTTIRPCVPGQDMGRVGAIITLNAKDTRFDNAELDFFRDQLSLNPTPHNVKFSAPIVAMMEREGFITTPSRYASLER